MRGAGLPAGEVRVHDDYQHLWVEPGHDGCDRVHAGGVLPVPVRRAGPHVGGAEVRGARRAAGDRAVGADRDRGGLLVYRGADVFAARLGRRRRHGHGASHPGGVQPGHRQDRGAGADVVRGALRVVFDERADLRGVALDLRVCSGRRVPVWPQQVALLRVADAGRPRAGDSDVCRVPGGVRRDPVRQLHRVHHGAQHGELRGLHLVPDADSHLHALSAREAARLLQPGEVDHDMPRSCRALPDVLYHILLLPHRVARDGQ